MRILSNIAVSGSMNLGSNAKDNFVVGTPDLDNNNVNVDTYTVWANADFKNHVQLGANLSDLINISGTMIANTATFSNITSSILSSSNLYLDEVVFAANTFQAGVAEVTNQLSISGSTYVSGNIIPAVSATFSLGTLDYPFKELYVGSGSISIKSSVAGVSPTSITNNAGNLEISAGGMKLLGTGSFIATTGSFSYVTGNVTWDGNNITNGSISSSLGFSGSLKGTAESASYVNLNNQNWVSVQPTTNILIKPHNNDGSRTVQIEGGSGNDGGTVFIFGGTTAGSSGGGSVFIRGGADVGSGGGGGGYVYIDGGNSSASKGQIWIGANIAGVTSGITIGNANNITTINGETTINSLKVNNNFKIASGTNLPTGIATLNGGNPASVTVTNNLVTTASIIFLTKQTNNHNSQGNLTITKNAGSFIIHSDHNGDSDTVGYLIINN